MNLAGTGKGVWGWVWAKRRGILNTSRDASLRVQMSDIEKCSVLTSGLQRSRDRMLSSYIVEAHHKGERRKGGTGNRERNSLSCRRWISSPVLSGSIVHGKLSESETHLEFIIMSNYGRRKHGKGEDCRQSMRIVQYRATQKRTEPNDCAPQSGVICFVK